MKIEQSFWTQAGGWRSHRPGAGMPRPGAQLAFVFGSKGALRDGGLVTEIRTAFPNACILGCSTAGEICGTSVSDDSLVVTGVEFAHTRLRSAAIEVRAAADSYVAGKLIAGALRGDGLVHVFVLSDGLGINGTELVKGLTEHLPSQVSVTGGLAGDGARFEETLVWRGDRAERDSLVAVGFYGDRLKVGYGSLGGWDSFGPDRVITRAKANVLYELDGRSALELYKHYLGEHAQGLPATGLRFPLSVRANYQDPGVVRTILSVNEADQSMTFAGEMKEGSYARLMRANFDRLIDGAVGAARTSATALRGHSPELAILISCVGRKMVLQQRIEEEVESVRNVVGDHAVMTGFYSYGEISPFTPGACCELHNQTMTVTTFSED